MATQKKKKEKKDISFLKDIPFVKIALAGVIIFAVKKGYDFFLESNLYEKLTDLSKKDEFNDATVGALPWSNRWKTKWDTNTFLGFCFDSVPEDDTDYSNTPPFTITAKEVVIQINNIFRDISWNACMSNHKRTQLANIAWNFAFTFSEQDIHAVHNAWLTQIDDVEPLYEFLDWQYWEWKTEPILLQIQTMMRAMDSAGVLRR